MLDARAQPLGCGTSHAKVILFGEHAALFGGPAIVWPLKQIAAESVIMSAARRGITVVADSTASGRLVQQDERSPLAIAATEMLSVIDQPDASLLVEVRSNIPVARGLGASAAMAAAVVDGIAAAFQLTLSGEARFHAIQAAEMQAHGRSSGIDIHGVTSDLPIIVEGETVAELTPSGQFALTIADSGIPSRTAESVSAVARLVATDVGTQDMQNLLGVCATAVDTARKAWDPSVIGSLMHEAHSALRALGVSSHGIDRMVSAAAHVPGVHGVKVTGGGMGGSIVAMSTTDAAEKVAEALISAGARHCWKVPVHAGVPV